MQYIQTDRERVLQNIAAMLASELARLSWQLKDQDRNLVVTAGWSDEKIYEAGELVVGQTSVGLQENPWIVAEVVQRGSMYDDKGILLRALGTDKTCWYGNESFIRIKGMPEYLMWEGIQKKLESKVKKAFRKLDEHWHCYRGMWFDKTTPNVAYIVVGERYGGLSNPTKPYELKIKYNGRTTIKSIMEQMIEQGYGTRKFELVNKCTSDETLKNESSI